MVFHTASNCWLPPMLSSVNVLICSTVYPFGYLSMLIPSFFMHSTDPRREISPGLGLPFSSFAPGLLLIVPQRVGYGCILAGAAASTMLARKNLEMENHHTGPCHAKAAHWKVQVCSDPKAKQASSTLQHARASQLSTHGHSWGLTHTVSNDGPVSPNSSMSQYPATSV